MLCDTNIISVVGFRGVPGLVPNITATATTGDPGTDVEVERTGPNSAPVLNFVIPRGEPGINGLSGSGVVRNTVTELRGVVGTNTGDAATTLGCSTAGDGGGGLWRWDAASTATDNIGTVVKPTAVASGAAGRWLRVNTDEVWVKWFGAVGDGVTDDAPAIQAAIDYAIDQVLSYKRLVPVNLNPGMYSVSTPLKLYRRRRIDSSVSYTFSGLPAVTATCSYWDFDFVTINFGSPSHGHRDQQRVSIIPTFNDAPVIVIYAGRNLKIYNIGLVGQARQANTYIDANTPNFIRCDTEWWNTKGAQDTPYAPHCGIAIDPYCRLPPPRVYFTTDSATPPEATGDYAPLRDDLWYIGATNGPFELRQLNDSGAWVTLRTGITVGTAAYATAGTVAPTNVTALTYGDLFLFGGVRYYWDEHALRKTTNTYTNTHRYYGFRNGGHYESLHDQYDNRSRKGTTGVLMEGVAAQNFIVGVAISTSLGEGAPDAAFPNEPSLGTQLGDSMILRDCNLSYNKVAVAVGQSQNRGVVLEDAYALALYRFIDCNSYGQGTGPLPDVRGGVVTSVREFMAVSPGWGNAASITGMYAEGVVSMGYWGSGTSQQMPLAVTGSSFKFIGENYTPQAMDYHFRSDASVTFTGCYMAHNVAKTNALSFVNQGDLTFIGCLFDDTPVLQNPSKVVFENCSVMWKGGSRQSLKRKYFGANAIDDLNTLGAIGKQVQGAPCCDIEEVRTEYTIRYLSRATQRNISIGTVTITRVVDGSGFNTGRATFTLPQGTAKQKIRAPVLSVGTTTQGSNIITNVTTGHNWFVGQNITGTTSGGVLAITGTVTAVSANEVTVSANATASGTNNTLKTSFYNIVRDFLISATAWYGENSSLSMVGACIGRVESITVSAEPGVDDIVTIFGVPVSFPAGSHALNISCFPEIRKRTIGTTTIGSNVITDVPTSHGWNVGSRIRGAGIPDGAYVTAVGANQLTISMNATLPGVTELYDTRWFVDAEMSDIGWNAGRTWVKGDYIRKRVPTKDASNMLLIGWVCTVSGTPGTWEPVYGSAVSPAV